MTIKDSDTTIVSINQGKMVILILMYYHSNTTIVSINRIYSICTRMNFLIQIQLLFLLIDARGGTRYTEILIQIQLLFLLIPIFISISFFIIAFKILLFKDIKNFIK